MLGLCLAQWPRQIYNLLPLSEVRRPQVSPWRHQLKIITKEVKTFNREINSRYIKKFPYAHQVQV